MDEKVYKIRKLTRADRKRLTKIFITVIEKLGRSDLMGIISSTAAADPTDSGAAEEASASLIKIAADLISQSMGVLEGQVEEWFADLLGITVEEFNDAPFDIEIDVIEQLKESPEAGAFFTRCWDHAKKTAWFQRVLTAAKTKYDSMTD
jgi:hypothetical protein